MPDGEPWPKISIVTPSHNQGKFLEETIRSVLLQGYPNLEYIVMDGGSTDGSVDIIRRYEPWLAYWTSKPDRGQAHAINKGWRRATGDILAWLNSDDLYVANALRNLACHWVKNGRPEIIYGDAEVVDEGGRLVARKALREVTLEYLFSIRHLPQPAVFMSRDCLKRLGPMNEDLTFALDFEYFIRAYLLHSVEFERVPSVLAQSREYPGTKSKSGCDRLAAERRAVLDTLFCTIEGRRLAPDVKKRAFSLVLWARALDRARLGRRGGAISDIIRSLMIDHKSHILVQLRPTKAVREFAWIMFKSQVLR